MRTLALASLIFLSFNSAASADSSRIGGNYAQRSLVVPQRTLRIDAGPRLPLGPLQPMRDGTFTITSGDAPNGRRTGLQLNLGLAAGLTENLDVGVLALPVRLTPDTDYLDPVLYGTYRFSRGELEAGVYLAIDLPVQDHFDVTAGIPLILHVGNDVRADLAALLHIRFDDDHQPIDLMFPFELAFNINAHVFLGPETGIVIADFDNVYVPLGFFVGYTFGRLGDLRGEFRFPSVDHGFDLFQILFRAELFFDL